jgi:hypothetical protein
VTQSKRLLLPDRDHLAELGIGRAKHVKALALFAKDRLELEGLVEIIDQCRLAPARDEDQLLDPGLARLVDRIVIISLGMLLVAGSSRVPRPATGNTALRTRLGIYSPGFETVVLSVTLAGAAPGSVPAGPDGAAPPVGGGRSKGSSGRGLDLVTSSSMRVGRAWVGGIISCWNVGVERAIAGLTGMA